MKRFPSSWGVTKINSITAITSTPCWTPTWAPWDNDMWGDDQVWDGVERDGHCHRLVLQHTPVGVQECCGHVLTLAMSISISNSISMSMSISNSSHRKSVNLNSCPPHSFDLFFNVLTCSKGDGADVGWMKSIEILACSSFLSDRPSQPATATSDEEPPVGKTRKDRKSDKQNITFLRKSVIFGIMKINRVLLNFFCTFSWLLFSTQPELGLSYAMLVFWLT